MLAEREWVVGGIGHTGSWCRMDREDGDGKGRN